MIDYVKGILASLSPTTAVIEAAGVGYGVNIALSTYSQLAGKEGETTKLFTSEIIREDAHELYGFPTTAERSFFELLMTVSGVGAGTARMILSTYSAAEIRQLIATGNARAIGQVKGLGPKTAQRIIVDLKDKVLKIDVGGGDPTEFTFDEPIATNPIRDEALNALTTLGFSAAASGKVIDKILKREPSANVEHVIRLALKEL